jgi:hypothetical protein
MIKELLGPYRSQIKHPNHTTLSLNATILPLIPVHVLTHSFFKVQQIIRKVAGSSQDGVIGIFH